MYVCFSHKVILIHSFRASNKTSDRDPWDLIRWKLKVSRIQIQPVAAQALVEALALRYRK